MKLEDFTKREFKNGVVYLGDAHEILPLLGKDAADVCVTSPPYNLNKRFSHYGKTKIDPKTGKEVKSVGVVMHEKYKKWYNEFEKKIKMVKGVSMAGYENMEEKEYRLDQVEMIAKLVKVCSSSVFYNHKIRMAWHSRTKPINKPPSKMQHPWDWVRHFPTWCEIIWDRRGIGNPVKNRYHSQHEHIYQIGRPTKFKQNKGQCSFKSILVTEEPAGDLCSSCGTNHTLDEGLDKSELDRFTQIWGINPTKNVGHICTFPEKMVEHCILPTTDEGDTIIDPYLGSGTTAVVAIKHGRKFIGIEIDEKYFKVACDNIEAEEKQNDGQK